MSLTPPVAKSVPTPPLPPPPSIPSSDQPLDALLRAPVAVVAGIASCRGLRRYGIHFLVAAIAGHAVFGLAAGLYGGWPAGTMALVKAPLIALGAFLICLPSLYVFSCLGGSPLSGRQLTVLGLACLALIGMLLAALAPVAWLFAVSTSSLPFVTMLNLMVWCLGLILAFRFAGHMRQVGVLRHTGGFRIWLLVFALAALQMATVMRPLITAPRTAWWTAEKQFFLKHLASSFDPRRESPRPAHR